MLREYTAVHSLPEHPNVVHYLLFWQESRKLHIQMELCEGGSLDSLLKRNELSGDEDLQISEAMVWVLLRYFSEFCCSISLCCRRPDNDRLTELQARDLLCNGVIVQ